MIYDEITEKFIVFTINHKNTINITYLVGLLWWRTNVSWKYPPGHVAHEEFSRRLRVTFRKLFVFDSDPKCLWEVFSFQLMFKQVQLMFSIFRLRLFYN
jgi:hypothetical protein